MAKPPLGTTPQQQAAVYKIGNLRHHMLLCAGPNCTDTTSGELSWNYLKRRIAELGLHNAPQFTYRTRCACLRICCHGPIMVIYPEGIWYHSATPELIERILREHILAGHPVQEYIFENNPLPPAEISAQP